MMKPAERRLAIIVALVLFLVSAGLSEVLKPGHDEYQRVAMAKSPSEWKDDQGKLRGTAFGTLLPTLLGVREVLASMMWVRADEYFHRGEYRPILQMIREIVAIDPHQIDVYATGAWHMAYNFMDKRLIQDGVEFLEDGCNKNDSVYDLFFELGYMHYDKTKDFPAAVEAYARGATKGTTWGKKLPPAYVRHQLAHAMEKAGDIDGAIKQWEENLDLARSEIKSEGGTGMAVAGPNIDAARHNLYITERRKNERLAAEAERQRNAAEALKDWQANLSLAGEWLQEFPGYADVLKDLAAAQNHVDRLKGGNLHPVEPTMVDLKFTVTRVAPRKILVEGTCNVLDLSRVNVLIEDKDYDERIAQARAKGGAPAAFDFKMRNCTLEWDNVPVNQGKFKHLFQLDKDPADMDRPGSEIYPVKAPQYLVRVSYNPRLQAAFIQDLYGWNGEGLTAPADQLKIDESRAGKINGKSIPLRWVSREAIVTQDDLLGQGKKVLFTAGA